VTPVEHHGGEVGGDEFLVLEILDDALAPELHGTFAGSDGDEIEPVVLVESALKNDGMPMRVPRNKLPESLVATHHPRCDRPTRCLRVVFADQGEDQLSDRGEQRAVALEKAPQGLGNRLHKLTVRQPEEQVFGEVLPEEEGVLLST
jgi:hypothetical protein